MSYLLFRAMQLHDARGNRLYSTAEERRTSW
jgi:hypothetical protein